MSRAQATLGFEAVESGYLAAVLVPVGAKDVQVPLQGCQCNQHQVT